MARIPGTPGRIPGSGKYQAYLPQVAATPEMVEQAKALAEEKYRGSVGAFIRAAVQEKLDREGKDAK